MKYFKNIHTILLAFLLMAGINSCRDLTELNIDPNGVAAEKANANLILSTVLTEAAKEYAELGYQNAAGVMQHTQKDAWATEHNNYEWSPEDWGHYYDMLRNNKQVYEKAVEENLIFHQGVSLVMKSFIFAQIADLWGDAPYTNALKGDEGGNDNVLPPYDDQKTIYHGILKDLEEAAELLSGSRDSYTGILQDADVIYQGDPAKWRKFANSLRLRYLMRISEKEDVQNDFVNIVRNEPIFEGNNDNAYMNFPGSNELSSWPKNTDFDDTNGSDFRRIRPAATLVEALREINDPRIGIWFQKVEIVTELSTEIAHNTIRDGVRYLHPDSVDMSNINTNPDYVGVPTQSKLPSGFNLNPTPGQTSMNQFVSYLNDRYRDASGPLLNARLMSYSELNFLLAEAALKGWLTDAQQYYNEAVRASLEEWTADDDVAGYLSQEEVAYDGTLERIITQKWIASWTAAQEAWFDYRRTGYPDLQTGEAARRNGLPLRYMYGSDELNFNRKNVDAAIQKLELSRYSQDEQNSPWSKSWLLEGTGKPY